MMTYKNIRTMMRAYINMDAFEITGSNEPGGQIDYYISRVSDETLSILIEELDAFEQENQRAMTEAFNEMFDYGADIEDVNAFFSLLRRKVARHFKEVEETVEAVEADNARKEKLAQYRKMLVEDGIDTDELLKIAGTPKGLKKARREKVYQHISQFLETAIDADNESETSETSETKRLHT